jgi:hypothetical protein
MTHDGPSKQTTLRHRITASAMLCFFASCAVYDAPPRQHTGAPKGGSAETSDSSNGGGEDDGAGRGGTGATGTTTGGAGTFGEMDPGGMDAGSNAAGFADGGDADADGGAGEEAGRGGTQAAGAGSASGGAGSGGTTSSGGGGTTSSGGGGTSGSGGGGTTSSGGGGTSGSGGGGTTSSGGDGGGGAGGSAPITELSRQKPATASSQQSSKPPASGNDGDGVTRWCASGGVFPQWWRVDLGATHPLKEFSVSFEYAERKYAYDIETSADDAAYTRQVRTSGTAAVQTGVFPDGVSARYVRITITGADAPASAETWASFFEFTVTGS